MVDFWAFVGVTRLMLVKIKEVVSIDITGEIGCILTLSVSSTMKFDYFVFVS